MKSRYLLFIILLGFVATAHAQFEKDARGEIIPFSQNEKYKRYIKLKKVKTYNIPAQNNDSLYWANNTQENLRNSVEACGFAIDTSFSFKEHATRFKLPNGTLWILKIYSPTAVGLGITFEKQLLKNGCLLAVHSNYEGTMGKKKEGLSIEDNNRILNQGVNLFCRGNIMYVEYFEGKSSEQSDIKVKTIYYEFTDGFKKKSKPLNTNGTDSRNKTGAHGTAVNNCQYDLACPEVQIFSYQL